MKLIITSLLFLFYNTSNSQSVRSIEIDSYKYIVIDEIIGKHTGEMRRFLVKNLKKGGYNIVNLKAPLKSHDSLPEDLIENPDLALYLVASEENRPCYKVTTSLLDYQGRGKLIREGSNCGLLSSAIKNSIASLISYNYKYSPTNNRSK